MSLKRKKEVKLKIEISQVDFKFELREELEKALDVAINTLTEYRSKINLYRDLLRIK